MGHYDLYGNSYKTANEAMNAEMSQCNEIDNRLLHQEVDKLKRQQQYQQRPDGQEYHQLWQYCQMLEHRIEQLEKLTDQLRPR